MSCWTPVQHTYPGEDRSPGQALTTAQGNSSGASALPQSLCPLEQNRASALHPPPSHCKQGWPQLPPWAFQHHSQAYRLPRNCFSCQLCLLGLGPEQIPPLRGSTEGPLSHQPGAGEMLVWDELQGIVSLSGTNLVPTPLPQGRHIPVQGSPPPSRSLCFSAPEHPGHRAERSSGSDWELQGVQSPRVPSPQPGDQSPTLLLPAEPTLLSCGFPVGEEALRAPTLCPGALHRRVVVVGEGERGRGQVGTQGGRQGDGKEDARANAGAGKGSREGRQGQPGTGRD